MRVINASKESYYSNEFENKSLVEYKFDEERKINF